MIKNIRPSIFCFSLILCYCIAFSQIKNIDIKNDAMLSKFKSSVPEGYIMYSKADSLFIERKDSVWILYQSIINGYIALSEQDVEKDKNSRKIKPQLVFKAENKWDNLKITKAIYLNDSINKIISRKDSICRSTYLKYENQGMDFTVKNEYKKEYESYVNEKKHLESLLINYPKFQSEKYALILERTIGMSFGYIMVYPIEIPLELENILTIMDNLLIPVK